MNLVTFSPDNERIVTGSQSGELNVYNVETGKIEQNLDAKGKFALSVAFVS